MSTERLFAVVFEGRPLNNIPLKKAIIALANLSRRTPDDIAALFNERPTVLKRGVPKETALQYCQALQNAGLACHITNAGSSLNTGKTKKSSVLNVNSTSPPPSCTDNTLATETSVQQKAASQQKAENKEAYRFDFPDRGWLISLASLSFMLPQSMELERAPTDLPPATMGQRIWAAISTFFHMFFMSFVMQIPVGIVAGLYLSFSDADVTRNFLNASKGWAGLLSIVSTFLLLPLLWRGHSFGQRAMGIIVVPNSDDIDDLSGPAMMLRRLIFRTRCVCAEPMSSRPWNSALLPFAASIVMYVAVCLPLAGLLGMIGSFDNDAPPKRTSVHSQTSLVTRSQHTLHQIDPAMRSYILESGMTPKPLTRAVFKEMLNRYMPSGLANNLLGKLDDGSLKLQGDLAEYRIGIYENGQWIVLNEQGEIRQEKAF
jgi:RDD family